MKVNSEKRCVHTNYITCYFHSLTISLSLYKYIINREWKWWMCQRNNNPNKEQITTPMGLQLREKIPIPGGGLYPAHRRWFILFQRNTHNTKLRNKKMNQNEQKINKTMYKFIHNYRDKATCIERVTIWHI